MKILSNGTLTIQVSEDGAELHSLMHNGHEYLWNADPTFWKRHSPVLFPIVGSVWGGEYRSMGKTYKLGQHGFARDMRFTALPVTTASECWFELRSNDETRTKYPYEFVLRIGYRLRGNEVDVLWEVENPTDKDIYFQIGAHPAFYYQQGDYFHFEPTVEEVESKVITEGGCVDLSVEKRVKTEGGYLRLDEHTFDEDALVLEGKQLTAVSICDSEKKPYLTVKFDSPLVGLWSPPKKNAPFVCIEPWYGRCDRVHYEGEYEAKDYVNKLGAGETFKVGYTIQTPQPPTGGGEK